MFDSLVGSILNYGAEIIYDIKAKDIESVHCKFLRKILCVNKSTNIDAMYGELARYPMIVHKKIISIKFWIKLLRLNNNTSIKRIYNVMKTDANNGNSYPNKNWASKIKSTLHELGLANIWINQDNLNINLQQIKLRILDIYKQTWFSNINNSSRLSSHCLYKQNLKLNFIRNRFVQINSDIL